MQVVRIAVLALLATLVAIGTYFAIAFVRMLDIMSRTARKYIPRYSCADAGPKRLEIYKPVRHDATPLRVATGGQQPL
jgi:hypothetical protein